MVMQAHNHPQSEGLEENDYMFRASLSYIARPPKREEGKEGEEKREDKRGSSSPWTSY